MEYRPSPALMDTYSKVFIKAFDGLKKLRTNTGFQTLYGRSGTDSLLKFILNGSITEIEVRRGNKTVANLKPRGVVSGEDLDEKRLQMDKSTLIGRDFPWTEEISHVTKDILDRERVFGMSEIESGQMDWRAKLRQWAFERFKEHVNRIVRLNEILAAQATLEGQMVAKSNTTNSELIYDFYRHTDNYITLAVPWSTAATATPWNDLDTLADRVEQNGEGTNDVDIFGVIAWKMFQETDEFKAKADLRRVSYLRDNETVPKGYQWLEDAGFRYQMTVRTPMGRIIHCFTHDRTYHDSTGTRQYYMNTKKVIGLDTNARFDKMYGPKNTFDDTVADAQLTQQYFGVKLLNTKGIPEIMGNGFDYRSLYFDCFRGDQKRSVNIRVQQSPLFVPVDTDCIATIENASV